MIRTLVLALGTLFLASGLTSAQTYSDRDATPSEPRTRVRSWIKGYLHRQPTPSARTWIQSLRTGHSPRDVQSSILASDEYYRDAGGTNASYVRRLYADVIGRAPLPAEINYWVGRLRYEDRKDVAHQMLRFHPRKVSRIRTAPFNSDAGYFPDPASPTFCDPSGSYFHSPYFYNYEKSRSLRAFGLNEQG